MTLIVKNKKEGAVKKTPHLALTHEANGPANGRTVSLVMKSLDEFSPEATEALQTILKSHSPQSEIEKATYNTLSRKISHAIDDRVKGGNSWGWAWVRDFDNDTIIYSAEGGIYAVGYSISNDEIVLEDDVISVNEMLSWEDSEGKVVVSQSDSISSNVGSLVIKSFSSPQGDDEKIQEIFKSLFMEEKQMDELKAQNEALKAEVEKAKTANQDNLKLVETLQAKLKAIEDAEAEKRKEARLTIVKSIVTEDQVEVIAKSLESLDDTAFDTITKSMQKTKEEAEKNSGLFKQVSKSAKGPEEVQKTSGVDALAALLLKQNQ